MRPIRSRLVLRTLGPALLLSGCASQAPLVEADLVARVSARGHSPTEMERALSWADLETLAIEPYVWHDGTPDDPAYWRACAWTWALPCIESRRNFQSARERRSSAGLPDPIRVGAGSTERKKMVPSGKKGGGLKTEEETEIGVTATLDILGLLDLGPAAAARELADTEVRQALGRVEQALWASMHQVERARARVAASHARQVALRTLVDQVKRDERRIRILQENGWLPTGQLAAASAMSRRAERRLADEGIRLAHALEQLSAASGLPLSAPAIQAVSQRTLDLLRPASNPPGVPSDLDLLSRLPRLRFARLAYATAEATVRRVAAERWPTVALGPRFEVHPDSRLLGGVLDLSFPWPGSVQGELNAAMELRELARQRLEDDLRAAVAAAQGSRFRLEQSLEVLLHQAPAIEGGTADAWRAARARFAVEPGELPTWTDRLERRITGCVAHVDALESAAVARLDFHESIGPTREEAR